MSIDRRKDRTNGAQKPLMPRLAASATPHRSGPAPRLAGYNSPTNGTPTRRPLAANDASTNTPPPRLADAKSTPTRPIVSPNVTPRSSARRSRAGSAQLTPTAPNETATAIPRPTSMLSRDPLSSPQSPPQEDTIHAKTKRRRNETQDEGMVATSNFPFNFTAGKTDELFPRSPDIRDESVLISADGAQQSRSPPVRPALHKKTSSFVYANGDESGLSYKQHTTSDAALSRRTESSSRASPLGHGMSSPGQHSNLDRPASPIKPMSPILASLPARNVILPGSSPPREGLHLSYRKGASQIMRPSPLSPHEEVPQRQISLDSTSSRRHSRDFSSSSIESSPGKLQRQSTSPRHTNGFLQLSTRFNLPTPKPSPVVSPINGAPSPRNSLIYPLDPTLVDRTIERVHSPTSTVLSGDSNSNVGVRASNRSDAANGARRERKILDLQISNSSLLAINRTLEKEMRRQKTELRKYKRATRNFTRASLASDAFGTMPGRISILGKEQEGEEYEDDSDDSESSEEAPYDESRAQDREGADGQPEREQFRARNRLALDLSKHKAMLVDSTALNQSLKRCLVVTEALIKDGKKALEDRVPSSELPLGGRVLSPEELEPYGGLEEEATGYFGPGRQSNGATDAELYVYGNGEGDDTTSDHGALDGASEVNVLHDDEVINAVAESETAIDDTQMSPQVSPPPLPPSRFRSASSLLSPSPSISGSLVSPGGVLHSVPSLD